MMRLSTNQLVNLQCQNKDVQQEILHQYFFQSGHLHLYLTGLVKLNVNRSQWIASQIFVIIKNYIKKILSKTYVRPIIFKIWFEKCGTFISSPPMR